MRMNNWVKFFSVIAVIGILTYITAYGANLFGYKIPGAKDIRPGIDIQGGVDAKLYAITKDGSLPKEEDLESAKVVIGKRLDAKRIYDRYITTDPAKGYILVQIPHKKGEKNFDPQKSIDEIGKTALLTFQEVDETKMVDGNYLPTGKIVLEGRDVESAEPELNQEGGGYQVALKLSSEGSKKFAEATGRLIGKPIAIFMDDQFISAPVVQAKIDTGSARITLGGGKSPEAQQAEAKDLASTIKSGALPFKLEAKQVNNISPTLGESALNVSIYAGYVAFGLVCLFMLIWYRLPGILAAIALVGHTVLQLLAISWLEITVTLPGIAGIILTIGMGVDANVIIFERIKEELRNGKTLRAAIDVGFKRAFTAIFDANITTLISAGVLLYFGTGPIKSFAYTLGIGVVLSFLTAVTVSRIMLKSVSNVNIAKNHWLYGA
ncbi:MAG: protein translocase subunit SecD [Clostridia bacterium]|nr:protein translocase subunit SecD [Clostridia bacterium]